MSGHRPFRELLEKMSPERRARIKASTEKTAAEIRAQMAKDMEEVWGPYDPELEHVPARALREEQAEYASGSDNDEA